MASTSRCVQKNAYLNNVWYRDYLLYKEKLMPASILARYFDPVLQKYLLLVTSKPENMLVEEVQRLDLHMFNDFVNNRVNDEVLSIAEQTLFAVLNYLKDFRAYHHAEGQIERESIFHLESILGVTGETCEIHWSPCFIPEKHVKKFHPELYREFMSNGATFEEIDAGTENYVEPKYKRKWKPSSYVLTKELRAVDAGKFVLKIGKPSLNA